MSRREEIESMLQDDPQDTFLRYALALELEKEEDYSRSEELFRNLMNDDPPYVPAFFMAGQMFAKLDRFGDAKDVLSQGIKQAQLQNDGHAAGEMTEFLDSIPDE